jgi:hypothetical protein
MLAVMDEHYPLHLRALERHTAWARDFAVAGDLDASIDEMRDVRALAMELRADDGPKLEAVQGQS